MTRTKTVLESVKVNNGTEIVFNEEGATFYRTPMFNPFLFTHGRSEYQVKVIVFYDPATGEPVITNNSGWFGSNNVYKTMCFKREGKTVELKKKKTPAWKHNEVHFVTNGKDYSNTNTATIYVPVSYLENVGYEKVETITEREFETDRQVDMVTPLFTLYLESSREKHFDRAKKSLTDALKKAKTADELKVVMEQFRYAF